jgi:hypothetical protein
MAPPIVDGTGRISSTVIVGVWDEGKYFVRARAEERPVMPAPIMRICRGLGLEEDMVFVEVGDIPDFALRSRALYSRAYDMGLKV